MSVVKVLNLFCDVCSHWDFAEKRVEDLRRVAAKAGWLHRKKMGDVPSLDLCPSCWKRPFRRGDLVVDGDGDEFVVEEFYAGDGNVYGYSPEAPDDLCIVMSPRRVVVANGVRYPLGATSS